MGHSDLDRLFTYHAPKGDQPERYTVIRAAAKAFATTICNNCPSSPERTLAIRDIQRAVMMANASIAVNEAGLDEAADTTPDIAAVSLPTPLRTLVALLRERGVDSPAKVLDHVLDLGWGITTPGSDPDRTPPQEETGA